MDLTAATTGVDVLPTEQASGSRWRKRREPQPVPVRAVSVPQPAAEATSPVAASAPEPSAPSGAEPAPLAAFGRWLADIEGGPTAEVESAVEVEPAPAPEPVAPDAAADAALIASLQREIKQLADELDTFRQRSGAERMQLLEQLSSAREARHAAETELAAVKAVLDTAEAHLPRPRMASFADLGF